MVKGGWVTHKWHILVREAVISGDVGPRKGCRWPQSQSGLGGAAGIRPPFPFLDQLKRKRRRSQRAPIQLFIDTFTAKSATDDSRREGEIYEW